MPVWIGVDSCSCLVGVGMPRRCGWVWIESSSLHFCHGARGAKEKRYRVRGVRFRDTGVRIRTQYYHIGMSINLAARKDL